MIKLLMSDKQELDSNLANKIFRLFAKWIKCHTKLGI